MTLCHSWGESPLIFTRDFVNRENRCRILSQKSLFTVTHTLFCISVLFGDDNTVNRIWLLRRNNQIDDANERKGWDFVIPRDLVWTVGWNKATIGFCVAR